MKLPHPVIGMKWLSRRGWRKVTAVVTMPWDTTYVRFEKENCKYPLQIDLESFWRYVMVEEREYRELRSRIRTRRKINPRQGNL